VARYWVDMWTFKKILKNKYIKKTQSDTWHATGLTCVHLKKIKKILKNFKKF